jgi:signal peptidase II
MGGNRTHYPAANRKRECDDWVARLVQIIMNHSTDYGPFALTAVAALITIVFLWLLLKKPVSVNSWGFALIIGGAIGNMVDRLRFGAVIDFLDFHAKDYHWPAFNIADSCVCIGVFLLIIWGLFFEHSRHVEAKT